MAKLKNGKVAAKDNIVAERLKNGGEAIVDWVTELVQARSVEDKAGATGVEECDTCASV